MAADPTEPLILDMPDQIQAWILLSRMFQLALELNTKMKSSRGSILASLYYEGIIPNKMMGTRQNKAAVLKALTEIYAQRVPGWQKPETIRRALGEIS